MQAKCLQCGIWARGSMINYGCTHYQNMHCRFLSPTQYQTHQETLSTDSAATLIHSFISSRIDYCNSLLYGVPKCHIDKLQRVQNAAARLVVMQVKFCHITPVLHQLHWLPVLLRINFKVLLLTFKAIRKLALSYINNLVKIKPLNSRYGL